MSGNPAQRINIQVNTATAAALQRVIDREGVSITEAVRRLVSYGSYLYRETRIDNNTVLLRTNDTTRELVII